MEDRLFCGVFPAGLSWCDRTRERNGDYVKLAFLSFRSLELEIERDCPADLAERIRLDAATVQARRGEHYQVSACGQTVILGS